MIENYLQIIPLLQELTMSKAAIGIVNLEKYICVIQGSKIQMPVKAGDPIPPNSIGDVMFKTGQPVLKEIAASESAFGFGYFAIGHIFKENDEIVGGVVIAYPSSIKYAEEWNVVLEQTVAVRTQALRNLLNNAGQGFLSFGSDLSIHDEYSSECTRIFDKAIHGLKFSQLIFPDDDEQENFLRTLLVKVLNNNDQFLREIYLPLLPTEVAVGDRIVKIEYKLIDPENEQASFCMVILTDITNHRTLETQIEQERNLLKMVVKVVLNYDDFNQNARDYNYFCETRLPEILDNKATLVDKVTEIFRYIHTFKGSFSQLGMHHVVDQLHILETRISDLKKNLLISGLKLRDVKEFLAGFPLLTWLEKDLNGLQDVLGQGFFSQDDELVISKNKLIEIEKKIKMILTPVESKMLIPELRKLRYKPFDQLLKSYPEYVTQLAERLEKSVYPVSIQADPILVNPERFNDFVKSLVHIFRNAVDHGLESVDERLENGKEELGKIDCLISETEEQILLTIADDGRGIDVENLRQMAVASGLKTPEEVKLLTDQDAIQLIFVDGFSTKAEIDDLAGRGVGLASVLSELTKLGGSLTVNTELGQGSEFYFCLPKETEGISELWVV